MLWGSWATFYRRKSIKGTAGSLLLAIENALETLRFGSRDDERIALTANRIVHRELDKHAISYNEYREWRKSNPLIFTSVVDEQNELIGFFDIFPLTTAAGIDLISGKLTERSLTIDHLLSQANSSSATHMHIATILVNPRQRKFNVTVAKEVILLKMEEFLKEYYDPLEGRTYTAFAQSKEGEALLVNSAFAMVLLPEQNAQRCPLYVLRPADTDRAINRFERAGEFFSSRSKLRTLDSRLANIELQLRILITSAVGNDPRQLPSEINERTQERIDKEAKRNAAFDPDPYNTLPSRLEFCDLRELEMVFVNKLMWPKFKQRFGTQEALTIKFGQVAALRNAIRHSRHVDEIAKKEGEAGIIWFERVLGKSI